MRFLTSVSVAALLVFALPAHAADEYVIMKVNSQEVSSTEVKRFWEGLFPQGQAPAFETVGQDVKERMLRAMMAERIIYGEAVKQGVEKSDKVQKEIEDIRKKIVVRTYLDGRTADMISEADLKKEYDTMAANQKDEKEVRARHILLATEAEAKEAKKKIDGGKNFEEVAKEVSKDAGSAKNGGDLGYFTKDKMVPEFASAAFSMKKGEVSAPVKSNFGYHIIKVEDTRKMPVPTFAEVKEQIKGKLQEKKLNDYVESLVKAADVKVFDEKGKEIPFSKELPTAQAGSAKAAETKPVKSDKTN